MYKQGFVDLVVDVVSFRYESVAYAPLQAEPVHLLGSRLADYGLALAFALCFPLVRTVLRRLIYEPAGRALLQGPQSKSTGEQLRKWNESCWKLTVYILFTVVGILVSYREEWFTDTRYLWLGCSQFPPCNLHDNKGVLLFYCMETGFYIQAVHFLIFHEVRRKDWLESMIHHIVTAGLLCYSYYVNFARVGVLIMLLHDVNDIFMEAAKLARYCHRQAAAIVLFFIFLASWIATRLVYFPLVIIRSCLSDPITLIARPYNINPMPHYAIFNGLLLVLLVLHMYWTYLILVVLVTGLRRGGDQGDIREKED